MIPRLLAAGVALATLAVAWSTLFSDVPGGTLLGLCLLGALPALAAQVPRLGRALAPLAALLAVPAALALALPVGAGPLLRLDGAAWTAVRQSVSRGVAAGADAVHPIARATQPDLTGLLGCALAGLAAAAAWQLLVRRRPLAGALVVGAGLAYCWTVEPPGRPVLAAAASLVAVVAILSLGSGGGERAPATRPALGGLGGGGAIAAVALLLAVSVGGAPAEGRDGWWDWRAWDLRGGGAAGAGALDLRQRYGSLVWPGEPRVALRVDSARRLSLRAAVLADFDGQAFQLPPGLASEELPVDAAGTVRLPPDVDEEPTGAVVRQRVELGGRTATLLAGGRPVSFTGPFAGRAQVSGDSVAVLPALERGASYEVDTRVPAPRPAELEAAGDYVAVSVPPISTELRAPGSSRRLVTPAWGQGGTEPTDADLGPYAPVRQLARTVAGDARTPYAAVTRIESHLRAQYDYDETPAAGPPDTTPLVAFLLHTRAGFCQQFAGSMAVMARSLGIPARVAVGYTGGTRDPLSGEFVVLDRDAHSWVEVWFPGHGWLPFDPTPGRSAANPASVSSAEYAPVGGDVGGDVAGPAPAVAPRAPVGEDPGSSGGPGEEADDRDGAGAGPWAWALAGGLLAALGAGGPLAKAVRRRRRRLRGDEGARVLGALRELEGLLADLGHRPARAGSARERAGAAARALGVDVGRIYAGAARARFAADPVPPGAGAAAWRELGRARRRLPARRRVVAAWRLSSLRRDTVS